MINIIVAVDKNFGIGKENKLLTNIKSDLEYFKSVTEGHIVVMGYSTYLSLPKRPLPNRLNIVLTRRDIELEGSIVIHSIDELFDKLKELGEDREVFICGGESIYRQMVHYADKQYVTHVFDSFDADTFYPEISDDWELESIHSTKENLLHKHPHVFAVYKRKSK